MSEEFFRDWFGIHAGREILVYKGNYEDRELISKPEQLIEYVVNQREKRLPAYVSVQPFSARNIPFGIEKLYFDFDCKKDPYRAWREAAKFAWILKENYDVEPFIKFSGRKGYHVDVFFTNTVTFPTWRLEFVKQVYDTLQGKILKGLKFETLDTQVIGDIKRLERVPYSIHQVTGAPCQPVDLKCNPIAIEDIDLDFYRKHGLDTKVLEIVCKEVKLREKWEEAKARIRAKRPIKFDGKKVRPCISEALKQPLEGERGHLIRLAIAVEFLNKGYSVDQIVPLFQGQRDFKTSKTRYYVEDAKRKGYKPFKCSTIRRLGFCLGDSCQIYRKRRDLK